MTPVQSVFVLERKAELRTSRKGERASVISPLTQPVQEAPLHHWNQSTLRSSLSRDVLSDTAQAILSQRRRSRGESFCLRFHVVQHMSAFSHDPGVPAFYSFLCAQRCLVQYLVLLSCLTQKQSFDSSSPVFRSLYGLPLLVPPDPKNNHTFMNALY